MASKDDLLFAQTALKKNLISRDQARECLDAVAKATVAGVPMSMDQIFISRGLLTPDQVEEIMVAMGRSGPRTKLNVVGDFRIIGKLGEGGMGIVYRAKQLSLDRDVALKILPPRLAADDSFVERFHREARSAARLNHPNIIQVYAAGVDKGYNYMAMELVDGATTLEILERKGRFPEKVAIRLLTEIAQALDQAHASGVVHRDIKPDNIMMTRDGISKLADLGLAKETVSASVTQSGAIVGTPRYMSPEQARGAQKIDGRADLYSLGASVYHLTAGAPAFDGENAMQVILKHLNEEPPPLSSVAPHLSDAFCAVIDKATQKDPADRYQSAKELAAVLESLAATPTAPIGAPLLEPPPQSAPGLAFADPSAASAPPETPEAHPPAQSGIDLSRESLKFADATPPPDAAPAPPTGPGHGPAPAGRPQGRPASMPPPISSQTPSSTAARDFATKDPLVVKRGVFLGLLKTAILIAVLGGAGYGVWRLKDRLPAAKGPEEVIDRQAEAAKALRGLLYDLEQNPHRYLTNLEKLEAFDGEHLDTENRAKLESTIEKVKRSIETEGQKHLEATKKKVGEALEKKDFVGAMGAAKAFPEQLLTDRWEARVEELCSQIKAEAKAELEARLLSVSEAVSNGNLIEAARLKAAFSIESLKALGPEAAAQLRAAFDAAVVSLSDRSAARKAIRETVTALHQILEDGRIFEAFDFSSKTLADVNWIKTVSPEPKSVILRKELAALRELYAKVVEFLEAHVGREFKFRSSQATIHSFKDGKITMDLEGIRPYRDKPLSEVLIKSDIELFARAASWEEDEAELDRKVAIFYLMIGEIDEARRLFKKLPAEAAADYQEELAFHESLEELRETMAYVPATKFPMGTDQTLLDKVVEGIHSIPEGRAIEGGLLRAETPRREIELGAFFIDKYEVSNRRYAKFLEDILKTKDHSRCHPQEPEGRDHTPKAWFDRNVGQSQESLPVVGIDWFDAYAFAAWSGMRLPTEAEWECAASWDPKLKRKSEYPWGSRRYNPRYARFAKLEENRIVVDTEDGYEYAMPVKGHSFGKSAVGCLNMAGNVWEWVADWFAPKYELEGILKNPQGPEGGSSRVIRGGSYETVYFTGRSTARAAADPGKREFDIGFRCAADPPVLLPVRLNRYDASP